MDNERYIIKYYYNDNLIGYHNSYGESRGMIWTRIYAGNDSQYIKKYNSLQGAKTTLPRNGNNIICAW